MGRISAAMAMLMMWTRIHVCIAVSGSPAGTWVVELANASLDLDVDAIVQPMGYRVVNHLVVGYGAEERKRVFHIQPSRLKRDDDSQLAEEGAILQSHPQIVNAHLQVARKRMHRQNLDVISDGSSDVEDTPFDHLNDPLVSYQTRYLSKIGVLGPEGVWNNGFSGAGVVVTTVDDGLVTDHADLAANYDPLASANFNPRTYGDPHYSDMNSPYPDLRDASNHHGTRVAGVIASVMNNSQCGVGVAYNASIGGIRMLDSAGIFDITEAYSISYNRDHIDIFSCSWGPVDSGEIFDGPASFTLNALQDGVRLGRDGLGSIFVWAAGNGGRAGDQCNADGYVSSPYTIAINAVSASGTLPEYGEKCTSILAATVSERLATTDAPNGCNESFSGTSAATPIASGIFALALEANSCLTWRDLQHIIVHTSVPHGFDQVINAANHSYSRSFGFGLLNAPAIISEAETWTGVASQMAFNWVAPVFDIVGPQTVATTISGCSISDTTLCIGQLEYVEVFIDVTIDVRGSLLVEIESPSGTTSTLLTSRPADNFNGRFQWTFSTVQFWDEAPSGEWRVFVTGSDLMQLHNCALTLRGTATDGSQQGSLQPHKMTKHACQVCEPETQYTGPNGLCGACHPLCTNGCFASGVGGCIVYEQNSDSFSKFTEAVNEDVRRLFIVFIAFLGTTLLIYNIYDVVKKRRDMNRLVAMHNDLNMHERPLLEASVFPDAPQLQDADHGYVPPSISDDNSLDNSSGYMEVQPVDSSTETTSIDNTLQSLTSTGEDDDLEMYAVEDADSRGRSNASGSGNIDADNAWSGSVTAVTGTVLSYLSGNPKESSGSSALQLKLGDEPDLLETGADNNEVSFDPLANGTASSNV